MRVAGRADNLTIRTLIKRFTRWSLGFAEKLENLRAAIDLHVAFDNFGWTHSTLGTARAVAAGLIDEPWTLDELLAAIELF